MRRYVAPIVAFVLVGLVVWSYVHFKDYRPISGDAQLIRPPEILLEVEDIRLAGRANGSLIWRMDADRLTMNQNRFVTNLEGIRDGVIYDQGQPAASVKAGGASYDNLRRSLEVTGGVTIKAKDGTALETSRLTYDGASRRVICPTRISMVRGNSVGSVDRMVVDLADDSVEADNLKMKVLTKDIEEFQNAAENAR